MKTSRRDYDPKLIPVGGRVVKGRVKRSLKLKGAAMCQREQWTGRWLTSRPNGLRLTIQGGKVPHHAILDERAVLALHAQLTRWLAMPDSLVLHSKT